MLKKNYFERIEDFIDINMTVTADINTIKIKLPDFLKLKEGDIIDFKSSSGSPISLSANSAKFAYGNIIPHGNDISIKISDFKTI